MINVFQEAVPFSNRRLDEKISQDGAYTNPIIMPFCLDSTGGENKLEVVFYIRNDSQAHYYKNVLVSLMKEVEVEGTPVLSNASMSQSSDITNNPELAIGIYTKIKVMPSVENYSLSGSFIYNRKFYNNYLPIVPQTTGVDSNISVKFSYGYDEVSEQEWENVKRSALLIPSIGNSTTPDMSYIPIRMRIEWKTQPTIFTIRDYFLDVTYQEELLVG
ncbi:MAG: hypothetical protein RBR68_13310 [Tenuifilaceae bacterium]|nr:hypothetical protein [Tenuifilaceae bacterium]